jgi:hypothetical protein
MAYELPAMASYASWFIFSAPFAVRLAMHQGVDAVADARMRYPGRAQRLLQPQAKVTSSIFVLTA